MDFSVTLKLAFKALYTNKTRSFLSILGIVIGISSVIIMLAAGIGAQNFILDTVQSFGSNRILIFPGTPEDEETGGASIPASFGGITITTLTYDDAVALRDHPAGPNIADSTATVSSQVTATSPYEEKLTQFYGVTTSYFTIQSTEVVKGRVFEERENESLARVAVLGPDIADKLFPGSDPIDQSIKINGITFKIIGLTEEKGTGQFGINFDDLIYIPVVTGQKLLLGIDYVSNITLTADSDANVSLAGLQAESILKDRHRIDVGEKPDFIINDTKQALEIVENVTDALSLFLTAIAAISLLVGGIGIMNIMLVSVTERTKEIGLRKAIGAKRGDILTQFMTEAVIITIFGGIIGLLVGFLVVYAIASFTTLRPEITLSSVLLSFIVSGLFGIIFGFYPANQASKLHPIEALRFQ